MGHEVYYEVYPDVIFGLHFGLNLFVLTLVNGSLHRAAGGGRICLGSLAGALCTLGALYLPGLLRSISSGQPRLSKALALLPAGLPGMLGPALALPVMAGVTFGTFWGRGFWQVAERLTLYSFGLGGGLLLLLRLLLFLLLPAQPFIIALLVHLKLLLLALLLHPRRDLAELIGELLARHLVRRDLRLRLGCGFGLRFGLLRALDAELREYIVYGEAGEDLSRSASLRLSSICIHRPNQSCFFMR